MIMFITDIMRETGLILAIILPWVYIMRQDTKRNAK